MNTPNPGWRLRRGGAADAAVMLAMIDEAIEWLVARGVASPGE